MSESQAMLDFVKALAHADRLRIVGVLVKKPATLAEIVQAVSLPVREVYDHLEFLKFVNIVREEYGKFVLDTDALEKLARSQFEGKRPAYIPSANVELDRQKVMAAFLNPDGSIRQIPNSKTQAAKFRIVLEYVLAAFEPGVNYSEKEVNLIIRRFNEDVAGLRRDLVDARLLARERDGSRYWRVEAEAAE